MIENKLPVLYTAVLITEFTILIFLNLELSFIISLTYINNCFYFYYQAQIFINTYSLFNNHNSKLV